MRERPSARGAWDGTSFATICTTKGPRSDVMTYAEARDSLVSNLRLDSDAHEAGQFDAIGRRFDWLEHRFPRGTAPELGRLHIALTFWDGWAHARNHGWPPGPISVDDWPRLARQVADDLTADREITNPVVLANFDVVAHPKLNERVQILAARLRERDDAIDPMS